MGKRVLVVDDEKLIVKGIRFSLMQDGMEVDCAYDGEEALELAKNNEYDLLLLDVMLPKMDGFAVCQQIRDFSDVPIVMLTAKGDDMDKILGLEYGADDYITKPFNILEVKARIKAIMRRTGRKEEKTVESNVLVKHDMKIDCESRRVFIQEREINLTAKEFDLLELLAKNPDKVYSREKLLNLVWGYEYPGDARTVDVHIRRLREKIEKHPSDPKYVYTKWGVGYYLGVKWQIKSKLIKSLRSRLVLLIMITSILPCIVLKETLLKQYEENAVSLKSAEVQNQGTILCNQLSSSNYLEGTASEAINSEILQLSNIYNGRVMVIDSEYRIVKDTFGTEEGKTIISSDVVQCFDGKSTNHYDAKERYIEVTSPIMAGSGKEIIGVVLISISADSILDTLEMLESNANIILGMTVLLLVVIVSFLSNKMVKPFARITQAIEDVTEGYDNDYLKENAYTETKQISDAFNKMLGRLKVLDDSRQEFVSNVSHELKTPLTSMKVLADSLLAQEDVPVELYQEFMGDITEEIERENKIINDLLSLVKMDKTASDLNVKPENINELVERILKRVRPIAAVRNIEVVFESFRPVTAEVDEVKLSLAISNLVENAIKYNKEDGWVHVSLNADHKYFYVKVADSGIGIPEESIEHIFERFYRVDKSHSREIGGTGLGLAIARNAIVMHRGAVKVYSEEGTGTTFTVRVPLNYIV